MHRIRQLDKIFLKLLNVELGAGQGSGCTAEPIFGNPDGKICRLVANVAIAAEAALRLRIAEPDQCVVGEPAEAAAVERGHHVAGAVAV